MKTNPLAFAEVIKIKCHSGFPEIPFFVWQISKPQNNNFEP